MTRPVHFVGSIPLADTEAVFRALAASVGGRAKRWPDGETGERAYWIRWQKQTFEFLPDATTSTVFTTAYAGLGR